MKQVLQNMRSGELKVTDVPAPAVQPGRVLVRTAASLISAGTEKNTVDTAKKTLVGKARQRPDLVKQVIQKAKTEGLAATYAAVKTKLDATTALGYSAAGIVTAVGEGVRDIRVGDRVACAGAGYASHAEVISVPQNLCVRIPDGLGFEQAAFGTLGAIALQGVRLAEPTLGEVVVVIGLGLLGQITVQLLRANGCRVFGVDTDETKFDLAKRFGADMCATPAEAADRIAEWSRGRGADAVLITAATMSNDPIELAGEVSRLKGRVVAVGLVGLDIPRDIYYHKELSLQISMSYGPGRYDAEYEERGHDYPYPYVRWTEGRNIEAFLDLIATKRVETEALVSHRFSIERAEDAYKLISGELAEPYLGILIEYPHDEPLRKTGTVPPAAKQSAVRVGMMGAGSYAQKFLLPNLKENGAELRLVASASGLSATDAMRKFGFGGTASDAVEIMADDATNLTVIATRHDSHASLAEAALRAGKNVFVEKPLAMNDDELDAVLNAARSSSGRLTVGFNRRFSPAARAARDFFEPRMTPLSILYRVNAGRIARDSWIQDPVQGGGRIIGEVCHFIDLMQFLTGSLVTRVFAESIRAGNAEITDEDSVTITLVFADGSNGTIVYVAEGDKALPKERIEIFGSGRSFVIDDFRRTTAFTGGKEKQTGSSGQDKGQAEQIRATCAMVLDGGPAPITLEELENTTRTTFRILASLRTGQASTV